MTGDNELLGLLPPLCVLRWLEDCYHLSVVWDDWRQWVVRTVTTSLWSEMTGGNVLLRLLPPLCVIRWLETMCYDCYHLSVVWDGWRQWVVTTVTTSLWSEMTGGNELLWLLPPFCGLRWLETMSCYNCYHLSVVWDDWRQWVVLTVTTTLWSEMTGDKLLRLLPPLCGRRWLETMSWFDCYHLSVRGGWGCEVSCGGHHRPRGKTTTGSALDGAVFDIAQILAYLVHNMSRSQLYLGFGHFGWLPSFFSQ